jgi:hypothetical protein
MFCCCCVAFLRNGVEVLRSSALLGYRAVWWFMFVCAWHSAAALLCSAQLLHAQNFFSFIPQHVLPRSVATRKTYCERDHTPRSPRTPLGNLLSTFRGNIVVTLRVETSNPNWIYRPCRRRHSYISKFQKRLSTGAGSYSRRWVA